jgi:hypothetical protein
MNWPRHFLRLVWGSLCFGFGLLWAQYPERPPWTLGILLVLTYVTIEALTEPRKSEIEVRKSK